MSKISIDFKQHIKESEIDRIKTIISSQSSSRENIDYLSSLGLTPESAHYMLECSPFKTDNGYTVIVPDMFGDKPDGAISMQEALDVYEVLMNHAGAHFDMRNILSFVSTYATEKEPSSEYRFQGHFGFGGKFRFNGNRLYYVDYYRETQTPDLDWQEALVNAELAKVYIHHRNPKFFQDRSREADVKRLNEILESIKQTGNFHPELPLNHLTLSWLTAAAGYPENWAKTFPSYYEYEMPSDRSITIDLIERAITLSSAPYRNKTIEEYDEWRNESIEHHVAKHAPKSEAVETDQSPSP